MTATETVRLAFWAPQGYGPQGIAQARSLCDVEFEVISAAAAAEIEAAIKSGLNLTANWVSWRLDLPYVGAEKGGGRAWELRGSEWNHFAEPGPETSAQERASSLLSSFVKAVRFVPHLNHGNEHRWEAAQAALRRLIEGIPGLREILGPFHPSVVRVSRSGTLYFRDDVQRLIRISDHPWHAPEGRRGVPPTMDIFTGTGRLPEGMVSVDDAIGRLTI